MVIKQASFLVRTFCAVIALCTILTAAAWPQDDIGDLTRILQQQTDLATRTRLNVDKVPGNMTVVTGREMRAKGARTVAEALELLRDVQVSMLSTGKSQVILRGVGKVARSAKVKCLLNGVPAYGSFFGDMSAYWHIPLEQVERIEVIRGPGSAIHGEFAYAGVINVVTRATGNEVSVRGDADAGITPSLLLSKHNQQNDFSISVNASGYYTDGPSVIAGPDVLYGTQNQGISNAPGPSNEKDRLSSTIVAVRKNRAELLFHYLSENWGDHFGTGNVLPPKDADAGIKMADWMLAGSRQWNPSPNWSVTARLATAHHGTSSDTFLYPKGNRVGSTVFPNGRRGGSVYSEQQAYLEAESEYRGFRRHRILSGLGASKVFVLDQYLRLNYDPVRLQPLPTMTVFDYLRPGNIVRHDLYVYLQDEIDCTSTLTLTVGARLDAYGPQGHPISPRIAAVYSKNDRHTFKAEYAEAFRPPTINEVYSPTGNPRIQAEKIRTAEIGYVYTRPSAVLRLEGFYSRLSDLIVLAGASFANSGSSRSAGFGLDYVQTLGRQWKLDGNLSYAGTKDLQTDLPFPDISSWTANAGALFEPSSRTSLSLQYRYRGPMQRAKGDPRAPFKQEHLVDWTATFPDLVRRE